MQAIKDLIPLRRRSRSSDRIIKILVVTIIFSLLNFVSAISPAQSASIGSDYCASEANSSSGVVVALSNGNCYAAFTSTGSNTWTAPSGITTADFLIIAGGGAGGGGAWGGGGGAGEVVYYTNYSVSSSSALNLNVGSGGTPGTATLDPALNRSNPGGNSWIGSSSGVVAQGGGAGASYAYGSASSYSVGQNGGSGGGGTENTSTNTGGTSTKTSSGSRTGYGNNGGRGGPGGSTQSGGGGGGAGAVGGDAGTAVGGNGGSGTNLFSSWLSAIYAGMSGITGWQTATSAGYIAGGGGGGTTTTRGAAGSGGAGRGGSNSDFYNGESAIANTGSGGGGSGYGGSSKVGGTGGSGLIIIRYRPVNSSSDQAFELNGSNQSATSSGAQVIPTSTASTFSVEAWVRQPASRSSTAFYQIFSQGPAGNVFYAKVVDGSVRFGRSGYTAENTCEVKIPTDAWTHVALVVGTASQSCYINGALAGSFTQNSAISIGTTFAIGQFAPNGTELFLGQIDEVKIWSTDRSASVATDMQTYNPSAAGLTAYYDFNDLIGDLIINRATGGSSAYDLTRVGAPSIARIETTTVSQAYTVVTFPRTYLVASGGWTSPANVNSISYSVVGGGGGGGAGGYNSVSGMGGGGGGGGGGGQVVTQTSNISPGALIPITVGQGGIGGLIGGRSNSGWGGSHGKNGASSSIVISGSTTTSSGGGYGLGGGFWGLTSPSSTACNTRNFTYDGLSVYYIDGIGGRGGNSGNGNTGGRPYCDSGTTTGLGGAGVGGAGNASSTSNLTSVSNSLQSGGAGTSLTTSGSSVEYGTGGAGGGGEGGGSATPVVGANGTRPGMGGNGGAGSLRGNSSSIGAIGGAGASGIVVIRYITNTPTILTQPLSDTTTAGIFETFTITTNAVPTPLTKTVQWQFTADTTTGTTGWTNVSTGTGSTTDTFTTAALTKSMNKYRYRAIVTFSDTSTLSVIETSTVAILTINDSITITSSTSTITRKYGETQTVRTITYSGGTTSTGAVGTSTSHTVRGSYGTLANGKIVLDTSTSSAVFRADTGTVVGSYVETITVTDFKGATATYTQRVVVNPADTLTVQADTLTAITYDPIGMTINPTVTITGLVASDTSSSATFTFSEAASACATGGSCSLGDTGPGGGTVFYISGSTYYEAAPKNWYSTVNYNGSTYTNSYVKFCSDNSYNTKNQNFSFTASTGWGGGKANTAAFVNSANSGCTTGAVHLSNQYRGGGKDDWYVPNATELNGLANYWVGRSSINTQFTETVTAFYWTSDATSWNASWGWLFTQPYFNSSSVWTQAGAAYNHQGGYIIPIRYFTASGGTQNLVGNPTNAGTYTITPSALTLANGVDTNNYVNVVYRSSQFVINKAAQSLLTITSKLGDFKGNPSAMKIGTSGGSDTGTITFAIASGGTAGGCAISGESLNVTSAGTCKVVATKAATRNYLIAYSDTATITFSLFVSHQPVQTQSVPTQLPINGANALDTATVSVSTLVISSVSRTGAGAHTVTGTSFSDIDIVRIGGSDLTGSNYSVGSTTSISLSGVSSFVGPLFIRKTDGQEAVYFQIDWS